MAYVHRKALESPVVERITDNIPTLFNVYQSSPLFVGKVVTMDQARPLIVHDPRGLSAEDFMQFVPPQDALVQAAMTRVRSAVTRYAGLQNGFDPIILHNGGRLVTRDCVSTLVAKYNNCEYIPSQLTMGFVTARVIELVLHHTQPGPDLIY